MQRISSILESGYARYDALPSAARQSLLPFAVVSLPMVITSLAGAHQLMPLVMALTLHLLYQLTQRTDKFMFSLTKMQARLSITFPLCSFIAVWSIALTFSGRTEMVNGLVGPYCLVLLIACAPAYRWKMDRSTRRVPLWVSFTLAGGLAFAASIAQAFYY